jgi:hypothetical protein
MGYERPGMDCHQADAAEQAVDLEPDFTSEKIDYRK